MSPDPREELRLLLQVLAAAEKCRAAQKSRYVQHVYYDPDVRKIITGQEAALDAAIAAYHGRERT